MSRCCCFFGHRKIKRTDELIRRIYENAERLITDENVTEFMLGSKSEFDNVCYEAVTELKRKYPHIKRIYVRSAFPYISQDYYNHLLEYYDETYYPQSVMGAGRASYIKRNYEMIDNSDFCIVYYNENYLPPRRQYSKRDSSSVYQPNSGTGIAYKYAERKHKIIINLWS